MGKNKKAKSGSEGTIVISTSPKQEEATVKILGLASSYGVTIFKAPKMQDGHLMFGGQRAVQKEFPSGNPQKPDVLFSMWANKEDGERVLAVLKPQGNALSIKAADAAIRTVRP